MAAIKSYRELEIWQLSMELAEDIYKVLKTFPREELYGLSDQDPKSGRFGSVEHCRGIRKRF